MQRLLWFRITALLAVLTLVISLFAFRYRRSARFGLPFADRFAKAEISGWTAFGGTWQTFDGDVQNVSDERGAKLITGSPYWTNYVMDTDVRLDGEDGDAGILLRVQHPDEGVDAYQGFYTGLRLRDQALIAGEADYGWTELAIQPLAQRLHPLGWYHLQATVRGCHLVVRASTLTGVPLASLTLQAADCSPRGEIGLRSYIAGGSWRHVRVMSLPAGSQP